MNTTPDFTADDNDPDREQQAGPTDPSQQGEYPKTPAADTGEQQAGPTDPNQEGEYRQNPFTDTGEQQQRGAAAPYRHAPRRPGPPQQPYPEFEGRPGEPAQYAEQQRPDVPGYGQHRRPPPQGSPYPPRADYRDPSVRRDNQDRAEQTSIIPSEALEEGRDLGGFFDDAGGDAGMEPHPALGGGSQSLFNGPTGGEPVVPAGHGARGGRGGLSEQDPVRPSTRRLDPAGWRKAVTAITFGLISPAPSAKQLAADELVRRIRASMLDVFVVAFVNSKGGVGKTTMAVAAGNALALGRGDRVIVVDVDTDLGNLSARFHEHAGANANIETFAAQKTVNQYSKARVFTVQNDDDLEMLSSQNNPRSSYRLSTKDFESTMSILRGYYNVVLLDCGTSITSPLFTTIAKQVDCLVVVASQDAPGLNGGLRTQAWLAAHGLGRLLSRTVVVLNRTGSHKPKVDVEEAAAKFREGTDHVVEVPFDDHLSEGGAIEFKKMDRKTKKAITQLAGAIARYYPKRQSERTEGGY